MQDYLKVLRRRWFVLALVMLGGGMLAFGWTLLQPRVYESHATGFVTVGINAETIADELAADDLAKSKAESYLDVARSRQVAEAVREATGASDSASALRASVTVTHPNDSALLRVVASDSTAEGAQSLADAWMAATAALVAELEAGGSGEAPAVGLAVLDSADLPGSPVSPQVRPTVLLGLVLGLGAGVILAFYLTSIDRRLRSARDVEAAFSVPVLGELPFDPALASKGIVRAEPDFRMAEAVRQLRTNLRFLDPDRPPRVIVVTSAVPGDGKSTVTIKIAEAIAEAGQDVIVVDADLRRPSIAKYLDLVDGVGLTDVLIDRSDAADVLQLYGSSGHLHVLGAGRVPPNPSELLGSEAMYELLYSFPSESLVLVDSPPLVPVTDAALLAARTDGAIVVLREGRTTVDLLETALRTLEKASARALGVVVDGTSRRRGVGSRYGAEYSYEPRHPSEADGEDEFLTAREASAISEERGRTEGPEEGSPSLLRRRR